MSKTKSLLILTSILLFLLLNKTVFAQTPPGGGCAPDECLDASDNCVPCEEIPIDGGIGWILAAGAVYGFKKLRKTKTA